MKGHSSIPNLIGVGCLSSGKAPIRSSEVPKSKSWLESEELSEEDSSFFAGAALATGSANANFNIQYFAHKKVTIFHS